MEERDLRGIKPGGSLGDGHRAGGDLSDLGALGNGLGLDLLLELRDWLVGEDKGNAVLDQGEELFELGERGPESFAELVGVIRGLGLGQPDRDGLPGDGL